MSTPHRVIPLPDLASALTDEEFVELTARVIGQGDLPGVSTIFVLGGRHPACWEGDAGQLLLIQILTLLLDVVEVGDIDGAIAATRPCPPTLAARAHDLLHAARIGDDQDLGGVDDATILCLALLLGLSGRHAEVAPFLHRAEKGRVASFFGPHALRLATEFAPAQEAFKPKLVIWDLDDTLWAGTLAEGDTPIPYAHRMGFVRALNRRGIISAICSKNDEAAARDTLEAMGLWDEFVFPRIAFVPKGAVVRQMIADMQLRPQNVLFVDDNPHNLHEVAAAVPGIRVIDAREPACDALLQRMVDDHAPIEKSRVEDYRLLELKLSERSASGLGDEAFLRQSGIEAVCTDRMDNLAFADRIAELINRSNQLNYTGSRVTAETIRARIQDIDHYEVLAAFVWDRYGYYGLVGAAVYNFRTRVLEHLAFSCRIMHMGVEAFVIRMLEQRGYRVEAAQLAKPLPPQSDASITVRSFADAVVRERVLAAEAVSPSEVRLRIMADCQSGAFHHYSRFREHADFDNNPRLFSLPQMLTGEWKEQQFPRFLAYAAATDYIVWRWAKLADTVDLSLFREAVDRFVAMVVGGDRRCLVMLPPEGGSLAMYELHAGCVPRWSRDIHPVLNGIWRDIAARHRAHVTLLELATVLERDDMVHNHHYRPAALRRIAGLMDDWCQAQGEPVSSLAA